MKILSSTFRNGDRTAVKKAVRIALFIILIGILGNILFSLFTTDRSILASLKAFRPQYLVLAMSLALLPWFTNTWRVLIWTRFLGFRFSFWQIFKIVISTDLGSAVSPTAVGGGYVKAGMLMQHGLSTGASASLMALGSVEDGLFFLLAIPASIFISQCWNMPKVQLVFDKFQQNILIVAIAVFVIGAFAFSYRYFRNRKSTSEQRKQNLLFKIKQSISQALMDFLEVYKLIGKQGKSRFLLTMLLTSLQWSARYSILTAMLMSFNIKVDPILFFLFQWITFTLMTFIPTPGAIAGAETTFYFVYTHFIPKDVLGFMTSGWRFMTFYFHIVIAVLILGLYLLNDMRKSV